MKVKDDNKIEKIDFSYEMEIIFYKEGEKIGQLLENKNIVNIYSYENGKEIEALFDIEEFKESFSSVQEHISRGLYSYLTVRVEISLIKNILQSLLKTNTNTKVLDSCNFILALIQEEKDNEDYSNEIGFSLTQKLNPNKKRISDRIVKGVQDYWEKKRIERIFYEHQGHKFHPCAGLEHHLFWGNYLFNVRDIKQFYGIETKWFSIIDFLSLDFQKAFTRKIEEMLKIIGDESFENVLSELCIFPYFNNENI